MNFNIFFYFIGCFYYINQFDLQYLNRNLIKEKAQDIMTREQRMKELENQIYRNSSRNAYYMKKNDYATIARNGNKMFK